MVGFILATMFFAVFCAGLCGGWVARRYFEVRTRYYYRRGLCDKHKSALAETPEPIIDPESIADPVVRAGVRRMQLAGKSS